MFRRACLRFGFLLVIAISTLSAAAQDTPADPAAKASVLVTTTFNYGRLNHEYCQAP
jgi:hypothetical protein